MLYKTRSRLPASVAAGIVCLLFTRAAAAAGIQLGALADNTLYAENGSSSNGAGPAIFVGNNGQGYERRGLITFDLSALPADATINSVSLSLFATSAGDNGSGTAVTLHRLTSDWGESLSSSGSNTGGGGSGAPAGSGDATWTDNFFGSSSWTTAGGDFSAPASAGVAVQLGINTWSSAGMAADLQAWLDGSMANYGWLLLGDTSNAATAMRFGAKDNGIDSYQPLLTVDYMVVPVPATLWLFAAGFMGLGLAARRR